jgi:hypothetical protein
MFDISKNAKINYVILNGTFLNLTVQALLSQAISKCLEIGYSL